MTFQEWKAKHSVATDRADRVSRAIIDRARDTAKQAGLDPSMPFVHAHNAMVAYQDGRPWPEVDYGLCRKVLWLERQSYIPHRLVTAWDRRVWPTVAR